MKIYSFLPSATEIVYSLGLGDQLCGVTHECDYPPEAKMKPVVVQPLIEASKLTQREIDERVVESMTHGHGLYKINREILQRNKPDIVITQELCDVCSVSLKDVLKTVHELSKECRVVSLTPKGLDGVLEDVITVGRACGVEEKAMRMVDWFRRRIETVQERARNLKKPRVFSMEWFEPIFASGHWVPEMVSICGGREELGRAGQDSRRIRWEDVVSYNPEIVILMPCGFNLKKTIEDLPLLQKLRGWDTLDAVKNGRVYATDGSSYYSRSGPRLIDGLEMMAKMIHPEVFGRDLPAGACTLLDEPVLV